MGELLDPDDVRILVKKEQSSNNWPSKYRFPSKNALMKKFGKSANVDGGLPMIVLLKDTNIDTDISVILSHCLDVRF